MKGKLFVFLLMLSFVATGCAIGQDVSNIPQTSTALSSINDSSQHENTDERMKNESTQQEGNDSTKEESDVASKFVRPTENSEEGSQLKDLPSLPDFSIMPLKELPFKYDELWGKKLNISYKSYAADKSFLTELTQLEDAAFIPYTSDGNFLTVGNYLVYYTLDSPMGPSKLHIDAPDGSTQVLLDSIYGLQGMFFEDRETLCLELTKLCHFEGGTGEFYFLNLRTGKMAPAYYGLTSSGHSSYHKIYRKHHYEFNNAKDARELGEAVDIYLQNKNGEFSQIIEYAASVNMIGNRFYYLKKGFQEIYTTDLQGKDKKLYYAFESPIWSFSITKDTIEYRDESGEYAINAPLNSSQADFEGIGSSFRKLSRYNVNSDLVLEYTDDTEKNVPLIANFNASLVAEKEEWLYFTTFRSGGINRYGCWKIKRDGSELTQLN